MDVMTALEVPDLGTVTTTTDNETIQIHVNGLTPLSLNRQTLPPRENILKITMTTNRHPRHMAPCGAEMVA